MRAHVTVVDPAGGGEADVLVDADPTTTVGELAPLLATAVRSGGASSAQTSNVVSIAARRHSNGDGRPHGDPFGGAGGHLLDGEDDPGRGVVLYVAGSPVDPSAELAGSPIREGSRISLDDPSGCALPEPDGLVEVRVVGGPGSGLVFRLPVGDSTIGSGPHAAIRIGSGMDTGINDDAGDVARLTVDIEGRCSIEPGDAAEMELDRTPVTEATTWEPGGQLRVGNVLLELAVPELPDAVLDPTPGETTFDYNRPPRLLPPESPSKFKLPAHPVVQGSRPLPIIAALAPLVLAVVLVVAFGRIYFLVFGLLSPIVMIANYFYDKKFKKQSYRQQVAEYKERKAAIEHDAHDALAVEQRNRRHAAPDPATALLTAIGPRARLWERRRDDPDYLLLRAGTGDLPSEVVLSDPEQPEHKRDVSWDVPDVPVTVSLRERGVVGVVGAEGEPEQLTAWMVAQLAVWHSPRDVQLYLLTEPAARQQWEWLRWLPHARPASGQDTVTLIGADTEALARRVAELGQLITARQKAVRESRGAALADPDIVVVLDGAHRLRSLPGVVQILKEGPAVGVYAICIDADERLLPEECAVVIARSLDGVVVRQQRTVTQDDVRPDIVPWAWFDRVARAIAPVRDVSDMGAEGTIPTACRLLDVLEMPEPSAQAVAARWTMGGRTTEAVVGASLDGAFALDLRRDGPHGLIAGTTGAGKSELLQTIVAALAVANRPDAMTFVLVDYKGGAAFKDCVDLPHTVGMVTDLDTHLVERALESLGAELHRREHLLAEAGAKDIEDYADLMVRNPDLTPMPRLLIVIDEFASLARELPDFVTGLVNIAQRGRSLGIHLILATQRPSGVVSPEIRANTNLRIALRVTDASESNDVLDAPDAGRISKSTPGRAYVRLGASSLVPFQAGRVGGRAPAKSAAQRPDPFIAPIGWSDLGRPAPTRPATEDAGDVEITDLSVLVAAIRGAAERTGAEPQHSPWLPALPEELTLAGAASYPMPGPTPGRLPAVPYGVCDLPAEQDSSAVVLDFAELGHLYAVGAPRSGRSQLLRTIAGSVAQRCGTADVHLFGLDCGNGALLPLADLPHCGAVVQRTQPERAQRLLARLSGELARRQELLGAGGYADITEQRAGAVDGERLPHLVLLLDRWEGFTGSLGEIDHGALTDQIMTLLREGASVGIHLILTGDRSLLSSRMATLVEHKLAFRLQDRTDYSLASLAPKKMPDNIPPGRAFWSESGIETQIALLDADAGGQAQAAALKEIAATARERDAAVPRARRPFRVDVLPSKLTFDDAWGKRDGETDRPLWAMAGVGGDELLAVGPDLAAGSPTFVVAGPPKSGRSTVLLAMAESLLRQGAEIVVAAPRQSPLRGLDGRSGVRAVLTGDDLTEEELAPLLDEGEGPLVWMIDDGELVKDVAAKDWIRGYLRTLSDRRRGVVIGGEASEVCSGFSGWQVDLKRGRAGALLSPQNVTDGDLVGAKLPRSVVGGQVTPGRALVHLGDGELTTVQVPVIESGV